MSDNSKDVQPRFFDKRIDNLKEDSERDEKNKDNSTSQDSPSQENPQPSSLADSEAGDNSQQPEQYGTLNPEARRALVTLLKQGVILGAQKRLLYDALCTHETAIRHHLADMFLDLLLDPRTELAILVQQQDDIDGNSESFVKLIQRRTLTLYDSLVLIVLRKHYQQREGIGESRVLIDKEQVRVMLQPFLPLSNNESLDQKKLNGALDKMEKHKIVSRVRGDSERLEITPVIRYVVDSEFLQQLEQEYLQMAQGDSPAEKRKGAQSISKVEPTKSAAAKPPESGSLFPVLNEASDDD